MLHLIWKSTSQSLEEEWRGHRIHVAWSPVWSFHSQWWFGLPCHLLVLVPLCFLKSTVNAVIKQDILVHFMLPSTEKLYGDADFIFQQDLAPVHTAKVPKAGSMTIVLLCLIGQQTQPDLNPIENLSIENLWGIVKRKMRDTDPTMQMTWRPLSKQPGLLLHLSRATGWLPPCHAALMR